MTDTDVFVAGAGPVGLVLAIELARRGVRVRIVDELTSPTTQSRAIVVHSRSLDQLETLGMLDDLLARGRRAEGNQFHSGANTLATLPFTRIHATHPFSVSVPQTDTESIATARLAESGVHVVRGTTVESFIEDDDGVVITTTDGEGVRSTTTARYLVGADGARSTVRRLTGQRLVGSFTGEEFLIGDVEATHEYDPALIHTFFSPIEPSGLLFPLAANRVRVFAQLPPDTDPSRPASLEWLQQALADRGIRIRIRSAHWLARFELKHGQVPRYRTGRVFLAGDAAHIHSPAGGLGMNTGIQDAGNLGWKLAATVLDGADPALLDSYQVERHPVAQQVISFTDRLSRMGTLHNPVARRVRNAALRAAFALPPVADRIAAVVEQQNVHYRTSPVVQGSGRTLRPGDHLFLPTTPLAKRFATDPGHLAIVLGAPPHISLPAGVTPCSVTGAEAASLARAAGLAAGGVIVVRPDGYVGCIGRRGDSVTEDYVRRLRGAPR